MLTVGNVLGINITPRIRNKSALPMIDESLMVGVEIEMEGFRGTDADLSYWRVEGDGSLRNNGVEFISNILHSRDIEAALRQVKPVLNNCRESWRAGIHVHVDVSKLSLPQILSAANLYALLERLIFAWEGNDRDKNNFCPPWYVVPNHLETLVQVYTTAYSNGVEPEPRQLHACLMSINRLGKYTALNLNPITRLGSIEFRLMQTTSDINRIAEFIRICAGIVSAGKQIDSSDALAILSSDGVDSLIKLIGCPFLKQVDNYHDLVWRGVSTSNILQTAATDFDPSIMDLNVEDNTLILGDTE